MVGFACRHGGRCLVAAVGLGDTAAVRFSTFLENALVSRVTLVGGLNQLPVCLGPVVGGFIKARDVDP